MQTLIIFVICVTVLVVGLLRLIDKMHEMELADTMIAAVGTVIVGYLLYSTFIF